MKTTSERVTSLEQRMKGMLKASEVEHLVKRLQAPLSCASQHLLESVSTDANIIIASLLRNCGLAIPCGLAVCSTLTACGVHGMLSTLRGFSNIHIWFVSLPAQSAMWHVIRSRLCGAIFVSWIRLTLDHTGFDERPITAWAEENVWTILLLTCNSGTNIGYEVDWHCERGDTHITNDRN